MSYFRIFLLTIGTFAIGTDGFMIAGLLPSIANDVDVSISLAGQLVTIFALTYAISSPLLATITANMPRKTVLILALSIFSLSNFMSACVSSFSLLFLSRMGAAIGAALYTPTAIGVASSFVSEKERGKAIAFVNIGLTVAIVIGAPFGTWIGSIISWQATFFIVSLWGGIGSIGLMLFLPTSIQKELKIPVVERVLMLKDGRIVLALVGLAFATIGGFSIYNYVVPAIQTITSMRSEEISYILVMVGIGSVIGNVIGGYSGDKFGNIKIIQISFICFGLSMLALSIMMNFSNGNLPIVFVILMGTIWGIAAWLFNAPLNSYLISLSNKSSSVVLSLSASTLYIGIAIGAIVGGLILKYSSIVYLGYIGAIFELLAMAMLFLSYRKASQYKEGVKENSFS